jgi:hypothetical protein
MKTLRIWILVTLTGLAGLVTDRSALAFEFSMDGQFNWEYDMRGQTGSNGFFGPYDEDAGSGATYTAGAVTSVLVPGSSQAPTVMNSVVQNAVVPAAAATPYGAGYFAPLNYWLGFNLPGNDQNLTTSGSSFASGSNGSWNTVYMDTLMDLHLNKALRVRGRYHVGQWQTPGISTSPGEMVASQYLAYHANGIQRSISPGYWNTLWMTVQLPWGELLLGKRPIVWGTGLSWNGEENRTFEHLIWRLFYGPFTGMIGWTPYMLGTTNQSYFNQDFDNNNIRIWNTMTGLHYRTGPIDSGIMWGHHAWHTGGEGLLTTSATRNTSGYADYEGNTGGIYFKYNNGQFFFNSEVDWYYVITKAVKFTAPGKPAAGLPPAGSESQFRQHWRWMVNGGMLCGPSKISLLYAWLAGPDRRGGQQIDQTGLMSDVGIRGNLFSNTGFFRPYSYLMVYAYGLGTHMNADTLNGTAEDASILAARVDYAVAANLNIFGSFFWADRTSQSGYGWGFIRPDTAHPGMVTWADRKGAPSIPDPNLGYEIGTGMDWKLLEGFTLTLTTSYWKPGKWFSYACVDKALPNWSQTGAQYGWGVLPNRSIDPVWGMELKLIGVF